MAEEIRGKPTDGFISRYINRRISRRITKFILRYGFKISPTEVTIISTLFGYLVLPLYLYGFSVLGGVVAQATSILDGVDGELARAKNMVSRRGAFIDSILDRTVDTAILIGASYYAYIYQGMSSISSFIIYLLGLSGWIMVSYLHSRLEFNIGLNASSIGMFPRIASRDIRIFIIFLGSIFGYVFQAILLSALLSYIYLLAKFFEAIWLPE